MARLTQEATALKQALPPVPQERGRDTYTGQIVPMPSQPDGRTIPLHRTDEEQQIVDLHMFVDGLIDVVQRFQPDAADTSAVKSVLSSAGSTGGIFQRNPSMAGQQQWQALCSDLVDALARTQFAKRFGFSFYCPSAEDKLAAIRPTGRRLPPKIIWPDITETLHSFASDVREKEPDFRGYRVPGVLTQIYHPNFHNVADDRNTRDYLASVASRFFGQCAKNYDTVHNETLAMYYVTYYEKRAQDKVLQNGTDLNSMGRNEALMFETGLKSRGHLLNEGKVDGDKFLTTYGCGSYGANRLFENMMVIFGDRNSMPPDVPANAFFRAQMSALGRQTALPFTDAESSLLRSVRKSCEAAMPTLSARQEMFCRCEPISLVQAAVPTSDWQELASRFDFNSLSSIGGRYPGYARLRKQCDGYPSPPSRTVMMSRNVDEAVAPPSDAAVTSPTPAAATTPAQPAADSAIATTSRIHGGTDAKTLRAYTIIRVAVLEEVKLPNPDTSMLVHARTLKALLSGTGEVIVRPGTDVYVKVIPKEARGSRTQTFGFVIDHLLINGISVSVPTREALREVMVSAQNRQSNPASVQKQYALLKGNTLLDFVVTTPVHLPR